MGKGFEPTGDWAKSRRVMGQLKAQLTLSGETAIKRIASEGERWAVAAVQGQNLGWAPLSVAYARRKSELNLSSKILIASSSYFQAISSWVGPDRRTAYIGVRRSVRGPEGELLADIARVLEYGSVGRGIPARPLWRPAHAHMRAWAKSEQVVEKIIKSRLRNLLS